MKSSGKSPLIPCTFLFLTMQFCLRADDERLPGSIIKEDGVPVIESVEEAEKDMNEAVRDVSELEVRKNPLQFNTLGKGKFHCSVRYPGNFDDQAPPPVLILISSDGDGEKLLDLAALGLKSAGWIGVGVDYAAEKTNATQRANYFVEILTAVDKHLDWNGEIYVGGVHKGSFVAYSAATRVECNLKGLLIIQGWILPNDLEERFAAKELNVAQVSGEADVTARENEDRDRRIIRRNRSKSESFHVDGRAAEAPPEVIRDAIMWMKTGMTVLGGPPE